jgi:hypothetical protein
LFEIKAIEVISTDEHNRKEAENMDAIFDYLESLFESAMDWIGDLFGDSDAPVSPIGSVPPISLPTTPVELINLGKIGEELIDADGNGKAFGIPIKVGEGTSAHNWLAYLVDTEGNGQFDSIRIDTEKGAEYVSFDQISSGDCDSQQMCDLRDRLVSITAKQGEEFAQKIPKDILGNRTV